ncbi:MAG: hypothetical protein ACTTKL_08315 [Treponema sp.]
MSRRNKITKVNLEGTVIETGHIHYKNDFNGKYVPPLHFVLIQQAGICNYIAVLLELGVFAAEYSPQCTLKELARDGGEILQDIFSQRRSIATLKGKAMNSRFDILWRQYRTMQFADDWQPIEYGEIYGNLRYDIYRAVRK